LWVDPILTEKEKQWIERIIFDHVMQNKKGQYMLQQINVEMLVQDEIGDICPPQEESSSVGWKGIHNDLFELNKTEDWSKTLNKWKETLQSV